MHNYDDIIRFPMCMYHPAGGVKTIHTDEEYDALVADGWSENRSAHATIESLLSVAAGLREQYATCCEKIMGMGGQVDFEIGGNPDYEDAIAKLNLEIEQLKSENSQLSNNLSIAESKLSIMLESGDTMLKPADNAKPKPGRPKKTED